MAESERYLPELLNLLEDRLEEHGLSDDAITIRMTGCPNGCARPYLAEIGLVGKAPGRYAVFLGAGFAGERLSTLFLENANESEILSGLDPLFEQYAAEREAAENFGDFLVRRGIVNRVDHGSQVHGD